MAATKADPDVKHASEPPSATDLFAEVPPSARHPFPVAGTKSPLPVIGDELMAATKADPDIKQAPIVFHQTF
jgi:hypothetical protein